MTIINLNSIRDKNNENITVSAAECLGQALTLTNLHDCTVQLLGCLGALHIYNCSNLSVVAPFVKSACNIYGSTNLAIQVVCQQMRINESSNLQIALRTKSAPALVDSSAAVFSALALDALHKTLLGDLFAAFADSADWKNVKDFSNLTGSSRNFSVIE